MNEITNGQICNKKRGVIFQEADPLNTFTSQLDRDKQLLVLPSHPMHHLDGPDNNKK